MPMTSVDVLEVVNALDAAGIAAWIGGGWGVDALVGRETRRHEDVDIAVRQSDERLAIETIATLGFEIIEEQDWRPSRVLFEDPDGRAVDLHPLVFDERSGDAFQANIDGLPPFHYPADQFVHGTIGGRRVRCIGRDLQIRFHTGYELGHTDRHDLQQLRQLGPL